MYSKEELIDGIDLMTAKMIEMEKSKPLEENEHVFNDLMEIDYSDEDRDETSLKKPQYFNRVKMGYDWNKYN